MERYRFIKSYTSQAGTIPEGSDITIMDNGTVYFNGGLVHMSYQNKMREMILNEKFREEYLKKEVIPVNKV